MPRFMRKGITKVYFVDTFTDYTTPLTSEFSGALALHTEMSEMNGFTFSNSPIQTPDMDTKFVSQIPGEDTTEDSGIVFYENRGGSGNNPVQTGLVKDDTGFVCIFADGLAGASPADADVTEVWPVTVSSNSRRYSAGNEAAMYEIKFATTEEPQADVALTT